MKRTVLLGLPVVLLAISSLGSSAARGPGSGSEIAPYKGNIAEITLENTAYRRVLFTGKRTQLVAMSIPPNEDIGAEKHAHVEQSLFILSGAGRLVLNGVESRVGPGDAIVITPGTQHDIVNTGEDALKLYTIYSPPNHLDGRLQWSKADADKDIEDQQYGARVE